MTRYEHLRRIADNAGEVMLEELHRDADKLLATAPSVIELAEYSCMLEEVLDNMDLWRSRLEALRRQTTQAFVAKLDDAAA